ncbi:MAG: hypothetical protein ACOX6J_01085 [Oscillospiraceae bacterium]
MAKKVISIIAAAVLAAVLCSCSGGGESLDLYTAAGNVMDDFGFSGGTVYSNSGEDGTEEMTDALAASYYGTGYSDHADFSSASEYYIWINMDDPLNPMEFGVFRIPDEAAREEFMTYLEERVERQIEEAKGYPSIDTSGLTGAVFDSSGEYIWYCAVKDSNSKIDRYFKKNL